jgi:hypothetical protein
MSDTSPETNTDTGEQAASEAEGSVLNPAQTQPGEGQVESGAQGTAGSEDGQQAAVIPESYEFMAPEGMEVDQSMADAFSPVFKDLGLSQEQANSLTGVYADMVGKQVEAQQEAFGQQLEDWKQELRTDADFGGDKFDENSGIVADFVRQTVPEGVREDVIGLLESTGAGNHPGLVKWIHHLATNVMPVSEDQPGSGQLGSTRKEGLDGRLERLYGNS